MDADGIFQEKDWKYMRSIEKELLHTLCSRINDKAVEIATKASGNPHERYLELFTHIRESDKIVANCFNDWRRSTLRIRIFSLCAAGLLQDSHVEHLSENAQAWLAAVRKDLL